VFKRTYMDMMMVKTKTIIQQKWRYILTLVMRLILKGVNNI